MGSFENAYKGLNDAQRAAVDTLDGPVLVIAGPGTGKTQLLSVRVANILKQTDSDPQNILCLTFTNKAVLAMKQRLQTLIGAQAHSVVVRTFHSFAAEIMNQYPDYFWNGARLSVAPEAVQDDIIQSILAKLPLDSPLAATFAGAYTALPDVKAALKLTKEAGLNPSELRDVIEDNLKFLDKLEPKLVKILSKTLSFKSLPELQIEIEKLPKQTVSLANIILPLDTVIGDSLDLAIEQDMPTGKTKNTGKWKSKWVQTVNGDKGMFAERKRNMWWLAVADVYEEYRIQLHERGYYDYSDMLIEVIEQLQHQPDMLADIQERYPYVLIDEFQDTNAAQLRLAHLVADNYVANNRPNIMAVGDDDQSIFAFNGAELNNMLNFQRAYPTTKLIVLKDNYRSSQLILDNAKNIIELAEDRLVKREKSITKDLIAKNAPKSNSSIAHKTYPTRMHQFNGVTEEIASLWKEGNKDIAVLARTNESLRQIAAQLLRHKVPIKYEQQSNILDNNAVIQVCHIAHLAVAIASGDNATTNLLISSLIRHPMWNIKPKVLWSLAKTNYSSPDWLDSLLTSHDVSLNNIGQWFVWLSRQIDNPLPRTLEYIIGLNEGQYIQSPVRNYFLESEKINNAYIDDISSISLLVSMASEFADKKATLQDFVRFVQLNNSTGRVIANETWFVSGEEAVELLTIYKAKGLEFEYVFVVDGVEPMWSPRTGGRSSPANLRLQSYGEKYDDYIRLLYVAASRAKRVFVATSYQEDDKGQELLPTPLLSALPLKTIDKDLEDAVEVIEENLRWPSLKTTDERKVLADRLENFSLSSSSLNDFLDIAESGPASFKERHLLRLPRARSAIGSYGTAVHAALETAQRLVNTTGFKLDPVLDRFDRTLEDEHLPPNDFQRFSSRGHKLLERLVKDMPLLIPKGGLSEQKVSDVRLGPAIIGGKIDRINQSDKTILISDYKTGKPLYSFETKDRTKVIKAWRNRNQLLFYSLLLKHSDRFKADHIKGQMIYVEAETVSKMFLTLEPSTEELKRFTKLVQAVYKHVLDLNFPDVSKYSKDMAGILDFEEDLINNRI